MAIRILSVAISLAVLLLPETALAKKKFQSLADFNQKNEGHMVLAMEWLEPVTFKGHYKAGDVESQPGNATYIYEPSLGAAGPALQILAQAVASKSQRERKYKEAQDSANLVLEGHDETISSFSHEGLYKLFKEKALGAGHSLEVFNPDQKKVDYYIQLTPEFVVAQDKSGITLVNNVSIFSGKYRPSKKKRKKPLFSSDYIVVSESLPLDSVEQFWAADNIENFVDFNKSLFETSVEMILFSMGSKPVVNDKQKTFRYQFGGKTRFERASITEFQSAEYGCSRTAVLTIGGDMMSLPIAQDSCPSVPESPTS